MSKSHICQPHSTRKVKMDLILPVLALASLAIQILTLLRSCRQVREWPRLETNPMLLACCSRSRIGAGQECSPKQLSKMEKYCASRPSATQSELESYKTRWEVRGQELTLEEPINRNLLRKKTSKPRKQKLVVKAKVCLRWQEHRKSK